MHFSWYVRDYFPKLPTPLVGVQSISTVPCVSMGGLYYVMHLLSFYVNYTTKSMFVHILFIFLLCYPTSF